MFDTACDSVLTSWAIEAESYADFIEAYRYTDVNAKDPYSSTPAANDS